MGGSISQDKVDEAEIEKRLSDEDRPAFKTVQKKLNAAKINKTSAQAMCLIDKQTTKEVYFSHLLSDARKSDDLNGDHLPVEVPFIIHSYDSEDADLRRATTEEFRPFCSDYTCEPAYALVQIGNIILEWDETNLLLPRKVGGNPVITATAPSDLAHHSETRLELLLTSQLLNDLTDVVVKYNTKYYYGTLSCNSHHLVRDVLVALEFQGRDAEAFFTQIERNNQVLLRRQKKKEEFNSHKELDDYVRGNVQTMDDEEKRYSRCHYTLFHQWSKLFPQKEAWKCDTTTCQLGALL